MGKKKKEKKDKKDKKAKKDKVLTYKSKCCNKYKKSESKRCKRCPCFDLIKKTAA